MATPLESALAIDASPAAVKSELIEAAELLHKWARGAKFDYESRAWVGASGARLVWSIRRDPTAPESYRNQQTSRGHVAYFSAAWVAAKESA